MSPDKAQFGERFEGRVPAPTISRDEAYFNNMGLEFVNVQDGLALTDLQDLFLKVNTIECLCSTGKELHNCVRLFANETACPHNAA